MISILIPVFNEQDNIPRIEKELFPVLESLKREYEVIIIDDGSKDRSFELAGNISKQHDFVKVVSHPKNMGLGMAIRTGIKASKGDLIIPLDSDFTFHPNQIPDLLKKYDEGGYDCIIGSHMLKQGNTDEVHRFRLFLSQCVNILYKILLSKNISSASSIFRLYKAGPLKKLDIRSRGFDINAEILFKLIKNKANIVEIPAVLTKRQFGVSKINVYTEIKNHIKLLTKIFFWRIGFS